MGKKKDTAVQKTVHRYPYLSGLLVGLAITGIVQILAVVDCFFPLIEYATDAVSSVMSTCSEVLAGLYGITLTGYIFSLLTGSRIPPMRMKACMTQFRPCCCATIIWQVSSP